MPTQSQSHAHNVCKLMGEMPRLLDHQDWDTRYYSDPVPIWTVASHVSNATLASAGSQSETKTANSYLRTARFPSSPITGHPPMQC